MIDGIGVLVIAEVGSVHDGSFGNALKLIETAAKASANVVKFQTHLADEETLRDAPAPTYFRDEPRYDYFQRTAFSLEQWREIRDHCLANRVRFMSSPFSTAAIDLLESVDVDRYKIGSGEVTNIPMLSCAAKTGKPIFLSSGMSNWRELDEAVSTILKHNSDLTLLQCTSEYPCPYESVGLNVMLEMRERYKLSVGFSDHTLTNYAAIAAASMGASAIEKHLTFSRLMYGSDARHSALPEEFDDLVKGIRAVEAMLGSPVDKDARAEHLRPMKEVFEKSIVSLKDIPQGAVIKADMIGIKKPGTGIPARRISEILGSVATRSIPRDALITEEDYDA